MPTDTTNTPNCMCKGTCYKKQNLYLWILAFAIFYIISVVPVGVLVYTIKSKAGFDVFKPGGVHSLARCLQTSFNPEKINLPKH